MAGPRERPDLGFKRDREVTLREDLAPAPEITAEEMSEEDLKELLDMGAGVKSKAERIYEEAAARATRLFIPVPPMLADVRQAVGRIDPATPDGSRISFELYITSIRETSSTMSRDEVLEFVGKLTGNSTVDNHIVAGATGRGEDEGLTLGWVAHLAILFLASRLMAGFTSTTAASSTKTPDPVGVGANWAIMLALMYLLHKSEGAFDKLVDGLDDDMKDSMNAAGLDMEGIQEQAEQMAAEIGDMEGRNIHHDLWEKPDWELTREYSEDFIANTSDFGYENWMLAADSSDIVRDLDNSLNEGAKWLANSPLGLLMPADTFKMLDCKVKGNNTTLDMAATFLKSGYSADMVCCLLLYLGSDSFDTKALKTMRNMLVLLQRGINLDLKSLIKKLNSKFKQRLKKGLLEPIFHEIRSYFKKVGKRMLKWMDPAQHRNERKWKMLFACTPIDEMVEYLYKALESLEKLIIDLIKTLWDDIQLSHVNYRARLGKIGDKVNLTTLIKILNMVIKAVEKGNLCAKEGTGLPSEQDTRRLAREVLAFLPPSPTFETPEGKEDDPFWKFNPVSFDTPLGMRISAPSEGEKVMNIDEVSQKDCLKRITDENIIPFVNDQPGQEVSRYVRQIKEKFGEA